MIVFTALYFLVAMLSQMNCNPGTQSVIYGRSRDIRSRRMSFAAAATRRVGAASAASAPAPNVAPFSSAAAAAVSAAAPVMSRVFDQ